jgi:hypothetical protein
MKLYPEGLRKSDQRRQRWVRAASFDVLKVLGRELGGLGQLLLREFPHVSKLTDALAETLNRERDFGRGSGVGAVVLAKFAAGPGHAGKQAASPD